MEVLYTILCDDIRNEVGNKISLMGIYDEVLEFPVRPENKENWPKKIRLTLFIKLNLGNSSAQAFTIRAVHEKGGETVFGKGKLPETSKEIISLGMVNNNFPFNHPGAFTFFLDLHDDKRNIIETSEPLLSLQVKERVING